MMTWDNAVEFGRALERIGSQERRLGQLETSHSDLKQEVHSLKQVVIRAGLVALLWGVGTAANLPAEKIGETTAAFLKALTR